MVVGVGVVGSGFMGRTWAEVAARHVPATALVAVAGGSRAKALAADYGSRATPTSARSLAAQTSTLS